MADTAASLKLTIDGAMKLLNAAMAKARDMKVPECIAIVDGHVIGGIGVGSGTGEEDRQVANAALGALQGAKTF